MSDMNTLVRNLSSGAVKIVDLTNTLSETTPTLRLPDPFPNLIDFSLEEVSAYNEPGPFWKHHNIHTGEHIGTHIDAPVHWVSGREGKDVSQIEPERLIGPAVVVDVRAEVENDPDFLLETSTSEPGRRGTAHCLRTAGCCCARAGTNTPTTGTPSSTPTRRAPTRRAYR